MNKIRTTGLLIDKKQKRKRRLLTEEQNLYASRSKRLTGHRQAQSRGAGELNKNPLCM
jgi:hypothetical protein